MLTTLIAGILSTPGNDGPHQQSFQLNKPLVSGVPRFCWCLGVQHLVHHGHLVVLDGGGRLGALGLSLSLS